MGFSNLISRYCSFVEIFKQFPFYSAKSAKEPVEKKNIQRIAYDRPGRRYSDFRRRDSDYDALKPKLSSEELMLQKRLAAVTNIQRLVRGFIGRCRKNKRLRESLEDAQRYWEDYYAQLRWEKEKRRIAARVRVQLAQSWVNTLIANVTDSLVRLHAAITIQRVWRGYWVRRNLVRKPPRPIPIKPDLHRRFAHDTLRRVWNRRHFQPSGGWPGRSSALQYDMWAHVHSPPKGRSYGLQTYKIRALPKTEKQENILRNDLNSWYGTPISVMSSEEARLSVSGEVLALKESSPFTMSMVKPLKKKPKKVTYESLGWTPEHLDVDAAVPDSSSAADRRTPSSSRGAVKPMTKSYYPTHKLRNEMGSPSLASSTFIDASPRSAVFSPDFDISKYSNLASAAGNFPVGTGVGAAESLTHNNTSMSALVSANAGLAKTSFSKTLPNTSVASSLHSQPLPGSAAGNNDNNRNRNRKAVTVPMHWKRESTAIRRKRTADAHSWTPVPVSNGNADPNADPGPGRDFMHRTNSAWGRLKNSTASRLLQHRGGGVSESAMELQSLPLYRHVTTGPPTVIQSRVKVWPSVARKHYRLRYTWLPQGLVGKAVNKLYDEQLEDDGNVRSNSCDDNTDASAAPSLEEIEKEFENKSVNYFSMEADLLSASTKSKPKFSSSSSSAASSIFHPEFAPSGVSQSNSTMKSASSNRLHHYHFL